MRSLFSYLRRTENPMPKTTKCFNAEDELIAQVNTIGDRNRWSFTDVCNIALKMFVKRYADLTLPGLEETTPHFDTEAIEEAA